MARKCLTFIWNETSKDLFSWMFNSFHYYVDLLHKSSILSDDKRVDTKIKFWEGKWQRFRWLGSIFRVILTEMHSLYLTNDFSYGKISFKYYLDVNRSRGVLPKSLRREPYAMVERAERANPPSSLVETKSLILSHLGRQGYNSGPSLIFTWNVSRIWLLFRP